MLLGWAGGLGAHAGCGGAAAGVENGYARPRGAPAVFTRPPSSCVRKKGSAVVSNAWPPQQPGQAQPYDPYDPYDPYGPSQGAGQYDPPSQYWPGGQDGQYGQYGQYGGEYG